MFLEDKIHGFKYTYISDENVVQQTKWYHSSIVLRKVHQFIIKNHVLRQKSHFTKPTIYNAGSHETQSTQVYGLQFELKSKTGRVNQEQTQHSTK